jgi:hypothetical protein
VSGAHKELLDLEGLEEAGLERAGEKTQEAADAAKK